MSDDYVLGLDLGPNSIGWALICTELGEDEQIIEKSLKAAGARVFEEGVENFDSGKEKSRAAERREKRSARRRSRRLKDRKIKLKDILQQHALLPTVESELADVLQRDPYPLRAKALDYALEPFELGRIIYHLNQRRGFKSNRKQDKADTKESGKVKDGIKETLKEIEDAGCRTLGEFLCKVSKNPELTTGTIRVRNRFTRRDMYQHEFDTIWNKQKEFHAKILTDELHKQLGEEIIFYQRSYELTEERMANMPKRANAWRSPQVRTCPYCPEEKAMARGHWLAQQFRILKEVNNLAIYSINHGGRRELTELERSYLVEQLMISKDQTFDKLRNHLNKLQKNTDDDSQALGMGEPKEEAFNLAEGGRNKLDGNTVENVLANAIGKKVWPKLDESEKDRLRMGFSTLTLTESNPDTFIKQLKEMFVEFKLDEKALAKLAGFHPKESYMAYSQKAVEKLLPFLEKGENEFDAIVSAGLSREEGKQQDKLSAQLLIDANIPNPVVNRCLFELRKVVNAIVREYGKPTYIRVEMAREMHGGKEARSERSKAMNARRKERDRVKEELNKLGKPPTGGNILRYELWEEQGGKCPYSKDGKEGIGQQQIFSGEIHIDHIRPRYRSLDDSRMNKVLCFEGPNRDKGNKTPYEWVGGTERHEQMLKRVADMRKMPVNKRIRFAEKELPGADKFVARQLNDTSYIAKEAVAYLKTLYPPEMRVGEKAVGTCRGQLTAELRRHWGLNGILSTTFDGKGEALKTREDHRHHAVDAVVVALSTRAALKKYQNFWKRKDPRTTAKHDKNRPVFDPPWGTIETFGGTVAAIIEGINVSHRVQGKILKGFHEATYYGATNVPDEFVFRVPLDDDLSHKDIENIRDDAVRLAVKQHLMAKGWEEGKKVPKGAFEKFPVLSGKTDTTIKRVRVTRTIKRPMEFKRDGEDAPFRFAIFGNNHHVEFARFDGKLLARVVPMIDVAKRVRQEKLPMVERNVKDGEFVMSLVRKDMVVATDPETGKKSLCVVQTMSGEPVFGSHVDIRIRLATDSRRAKEGNKTPYKRLSSAGTWEDYSIQKVIVDPLGNIREVND